MKKFFAILLVAGVGVLHTCISNAAAPSVVASGPSSKAKISAELSELLAETGQIGAGSPVLVTLIGPNKELLETMGVKFKKSVAHFIEGSDAIIVRRCVGDKVTPHVIFSFDKGVIEGNISDKDGLLLTSNIVARIKDILDAYKKPAPVDPNTIT